MFCCCLLASVKSVDQTLTFTVADMPLALSSQYAMLTRTCVGACAIRDRPVCAGRQKDLEKVVYYLLTRFVGSTNVFHVSREWKTQKREDSRCVRRFSLVLVVGLTRKSLGTRTRKLKLGSSALQSMTPTEQCILYTRTSSVLSRC